MESYDKAMDHIKVIQRIAHYGNISFDFHNSIDYGMGYFQLL